MGATRQSMSIEPRAAGMVPGRTPGPFGRGDAGDPDAPLCRAGDTPGPVGTGDDGGTPADPAIGAPMQVSLVDERIVVGRIRRLAFVRASLAEARADMAAHLRADATAVMLRADALRRELLGEWLRAKRTSGDAVLAFCRELDDANDAEFAALMSSYGAETARGRERARWIGYGGVAVSTAGFVSTVVRKIGASVDNPIGWGIDVATDMAIAAIDAELDRDAASAADRAAFEKAVEELLKKGIEEAPEKLPAKIERVYQLAERLGPEVAKLEALRPQLEAKLLRIDALAREARRRTGAMRRASLGAARLRELLRAQRAVVAPLRGAAALSKVGGASTRAAAGWVERTGVGKAAGGAAGIVFVASDVHEAYERWLRETRGFLQP